LAFSYWIDIPWFHNWGKTCCYIHQTFSWGFQLVGHLLHQLHANKFSGTIHHRAIKHNQVFLRRCRGKRSLLQGEFRTHILYFVLSFAFTLFFACIILSKTQKI
jgi:hypothetical protein